MAEGSMRSFGTPGGADGDQRTLDLFHTRRFSVLRFYVLRFTFYVLRFTFYVLRFTFYVLRFTFYGVDRV